MLTLPLCAAALPMQFKALVFSRSMYRLGYLLKLLGVDDGLTLRGVIEVNIGGLDGPVLYDLEHGLLQLLHPVARIVQEGHTVKPVVENVCRSHNGCR